MALNPVTLSNEILKFSDPSNGAFVGFPATVQETAEKWADAFIAFFSQATVPPTLGAAVAAGRGAMIAAMVATAAGGDFYPPGAGIIALGNGLQALVLPAAAPPPAGVTPPPAICVPPPALYVPPPLPPVTNPVIPATAIASTALAWALTGTFTPGPPVAPAPWA